MGYTMNAGPLKFNSDSKPKAMEVLAFYVVGITLMYLVAAFTLYCFVNLTGLLEFSWVHSGYMMVLLGVARWVFTGE